MAETYEGLYVKFGANTVEFDNSVKGMNKALAGLKKDISTLNKQLKFDPDNVDLLNQKLANFKEQARVGALKIKELRKQQEALGKDKVGTAEWNKLELEINKVEAQMVSVNNAASKTKKRIQDVGDPQSVYNLDKSINDVAADLDIVNRKLKLDPSNVELSAEKMKLLGEQAKLANQKVESLKREQQALGSKNIGTNEWKSLQRAIGNAEIEAKQLENAIQDVGDPQSVYNLDKAINDVAADLDIVNRKLQLDPSNVDLSAKKMLLLKEQSELANQKVVSLMKELASFGIEDIGTAEFKEVQRALGNAEIEAKQLENAIEDLGNAGKEASDEVGEIKNSLSAGAIGGAVSGAVQSMADSLGNLIEETKEYRMIMASLEESSKNAGYSASETRQVYQTLQGVLGDTQSAATATANLQALGLSQQDLMNVTNASIGAWAKYGDSIPIDGLAESINETIKAGQVTGTFADVLNWAGTNEDEFNQKLSQCKTDAERTNVVMQELAKQGLTQSGKAWQENNKDMVEANNAQDNLNQALSGLAQTLQPIMTAIIQGLTQVVNWFNNLSPAGKTVVAIIGAIIGILILLGPLIMSVVTAMVASVPASTAAGAAAGGAAVGFGALAAPLLLIIGIIAAVVIAIAGIIIAIKNWGAITDWLSNKWNAFKEWISNLWNNIKSIFTNALNNIKTTVSNAWNNIQSFFSNGIQNVINIVSNIKSKIADKFKGLPTAIKNGIGNLASVGTAIINGILNGLAGIGGKIKDKIVDGISSAKRGLGSIINSIFGKSYGGMNYNVGVNGGSFLNDVIKMQKGFSMPKIMAGTNSATTLNISVSANNSNGMEIARAVERVIVRRLT